MTRVRKEGQLSSSLAVTATDLMIFSTAFYFQAHADALTPATPAVTYLMDQPKPFRILVAPALNQRFGNTCPAATDPQRNLLLMLTDPSALSVRSVRPTLPRLWRANRQAPFCKRQSSGGYVSPSW